MKNSDLLDVLTELKATRLLATEADGLIGPLREHKFSLNLSFVSASRSLGVQQYPTYNKGYTVLCKIVGADSECSVLFPPSENERIEGHGTGDKFELDIRVIDYDSLYQRVIFGQVVDGSDPTEEVAEKLPADKPETLPEPEERKIPKPDLGPKEGKRKLAGFDQDGDGKVSAEERGDSEKVQVKRDKPKDKEEEDVENEANEFEVKLDFAAAELKSAALSIRSAVGIVFLGVFFRIFPSVRSSSEKPTKINDRLNVFAIIFYIIAGISFVRLNGFALLFWVTVICIVLGCILQEARSRVKKK